jgi:hypothetical protein
MAHILTMAKDVSLCDIERDCNIIDEDGSVSNVHRYIIAKDSLLRKELQ